jgi:hypothetical protein
VTKRLVVFSVAGPDISGDYVVSLGVWDGVTEPEALGAVAVPGPQGQALRRLLAAAPLVSDRGEAP